MIAGVIVLYYPDRTLLERLLTSLSGQVSKVVAIDNTPGSSATMAPFLGVCPYPISYIPLGENKGIAEAQNIGIREVITCGCSHVLLLDQDSALPSGMVEKLVVAEGELLKAGEKVAAVGPRYTDEKTGISSFAVRYRGATVRKIRLDPNSSIPVETDILIASGSIIRIEVLEAVGMMRADLFIDFVDTEWALRARSKGYKSYCVPDAIMVHSIGDSAVKVFGMSMYLHGDLRKYYAVRNAAYLLRLPSMGWRWRGYNLCWIPYYIFLNLWAAKKKLPNASLFLNALWDGFLGRLGPAQQWRVPLRTGLVEDSVSLRAGR